MTDALWYVAPGVTEVRATALAPLEPGWVEVETEASLLSRGTERLIASGRVPQSEHARMRAPLQEGDFPFPVKYGYAAAGRVSAGPASLLGRQVFTLAPHQRRLRVPEAMALPLPEGMSPARAVFAANVETAINALWDAESAPGLPPGTRVLVIGLGLVGLLMVKVLGTRSGLTIGAVDVIPQRRTRAEHFSGTFYSPSELTAENAGTWDVVFHTSANPAGLETALNALRFEGTVIEMSWYGDKPVPVPLGGAFHARRLTIKSSQVGHIAPSRRSVTTHRDRLAAALALCDDPRLETLVTEEIALEDVPAATHRLFAPDADGIATRIVYR
ncbi:MAG: zinc-binding alcohol dehydrogenase [Pseudomonadota bacterium]